MTEKTIVHIPNVAEEVRIGYSFNYMIKVIAETEAAEEEPAEETPEVTEAPAEDESAEEAPEAAEKGLRAGL